MGIGLVSPRDEQLLQACLSTSKNGLSCDRAASDRCRSHVERTRDLVANRIEQQRRSEQQAERQCPTSPAGTCASLTCGMIWYYKRYSNTEAPSCSFPAGSSRHRPSRQLQPRMGPPTTSCLTLTSSQTSSGTRTRHTKHNAQATACLLFLNDGVTLCMASLQDGARHRHCGT